MPAPRSLIRQHILTHFPEQLTYPQKKKRMTMAQFGYNLSFFGIQVFRIRGFIKPDKFGIHSFGEPDLKERNGCLYTRKGGFIDFSHLRAGIDWTVYLSFLILTDPSRIELPPEAGELTLRFMNTEYLTVEDAIAVAQKIAFERLQWHEVASWFYHKPYKFRCDTQSSFTPEDTYSNFIGCVIGKNIAMRILDNSDTASFRRIATEEIEKEISRIDPVASVEETAHAYDLVDRSVQLRLPPGQQNPDVWWDRRIQFRDQRYIFKRDLTVGPELIPWLIPFPNEPDCKDYSGGGEILYVPRTTSTGVSVDDYYEFRITPDTGMFYSRDGEKVHEPFSSFLTRDFDDVISSIGKEMEQILLPGFDKRNNFDPVLLYKNVKEVRYIREFLRRPQHFDVGVEQTASGNGR